MTTVKEIVDKITKAIEGAYDGDWTIDRFKAENGDYWGLIVNNNDTIIAEIRGALDYCGNRENAEYIIATQPKNMRVILEALAMLPSEPIGEAGPMPGSNGGFTMAAFKATDVPVGTKLYTSPTPHPSLDREGLLEEARSIATKIVGQKAFLALTTGDGQPYAKVTFSEQEGLRSFIDGTIELRAFLSKLEASSK